MKRYLLIASILFLCVLSSKCFAGDTHTVTLDDTFTYGTIAANSQITQTVIHSAEKEPGRWFLTANIHPRPVTSHFGNETIFALPYKNYVTGTGIINNNVCYEEINMYISSSRRTFTIERKIINLTNESQTYSNYEGSIIVYKFK